MSLTDSHHNHHGQKPTMVGICHGGNVPVSHDDVDDDEDDDDVDDDDDDGYPAHSHHDKFPPWWDFVRDDDGGNLSVTKSHH